MDRNNQVNSYYDPIYREFNYKNVKKEDYWYSQFGEPHFNGDDFKPLKGDVPINPNNPPKRPRRFYR